MLYSGIFFICLYWKTFSIIKTNYNKNKHLGKEIHSLSSLEFKIGGTN